MNNIFKKTNIINKISLVFILSLIKTKLYNYIHFNFNVDIISISQSKNVSLNKLIFGG